MAKFYSTKTYGNEQGLSCCFRQWAAEHSHCSLLHGYSIGVKLTFECESFDERNWVQDFGGLKDFKEWLKYMFDHTLLVAEDDPLLDNFTALESIQGGWENKGIVDLRIVPGVGCEKFAQLIHNTLSEMLHVNKHNSLNPTVKLKSVEVFEHGANSAIYEE